MPKSQNQKLKILLLKDILYRYTDENHPLSANSIIDTLRECDIEAERKSIYNDIENLASYGMDILKINGREGGFFLGSREFELAELKMLIDAVQSSKFISGKKSEQLVKKISELASVYDEDELKRQVYRVNNVKSQNESILYIIDDINEAIRNNRKIDFKYLDWTTELKLKPRKNGEIYQVSPVSLIWDDEYYYLVAYDAEADMIKHYRVDKMSDIAISEEECDKHDKVKLEDYAGRVFGMFGGETVNVTVLCPKNKIGILIDRFGQDIKITAGDEETVKVHTDVVLSSQFYGWMASIGPDTRLVAPANAVEAYKTFLKDNLSRY